MICALHRPVTQRYRFFFCLIYSVTYDVSRYIVTIFKYPICHSPRFNVFLLNINHDFRPTNWLSNVSVSFSSSLRDTFCIVMNPILPMILTVVNVISLVKYFHRLEMSHINMIINILTRDRYIYIYMSIFINMSLASSALMFSEYVVFFLRHPIRYYLGSFSKKYEQWNKIRQKSWKSWANWRAEYELMQCIS